MAIVTGASVYHLGWQIPAWSQAKELETVTRALAHARELALEKLRAAGRHLGAEAIVGVTLDTRPQSPGRRLTEVVALGTAVRDRAGLLRRAPGNEIVTSNLSGQEMALLIQSGHQPVALVAGNCVYHAGYQNASRWLSQVGRNVEMPTFTQALADARELALARMQAEATASGADGILGVALTEHEHAWGSHVIECFVLGTAIAATGETPSLGDVPFILSLNDPPEPMPPPPPPPPADNGGGADAALAGIG